MTLDSMKIHTFLNRFKIIRSLSQEKSLVI